MIAAEVDRVDVLGCIKRQVVVAVTDNVGAAKLQHLADEYVRRQQMAVFELFQQRLAESGLVMLASFGQRGSLLAPNSGKPIPGTLTARIVFARATINALIHG
ncbi:MAG: hypothetical protein VB875_15765 [Pirellulales bacterium]